MGAIGKRPYSSRGVIVVRSVKQRNLNLNSKSNATNKDLTEKEKSQEKRNDKFVRESNAEVNEKL